VLRNVVIAGLAGLVSLGASAWLTGWMREFAWRQALLDHPGERSSHTAPTPRGGGVAVVLVVLLALGCAVAAGLLDSVPGLLLAWIVAGAAVVGALDDRFTLPVVPRLAAHLGIAIVAVWIGGSFPSFGIAGTSVVFPASAAAILSVLWIVWIGNLYNFMDGIDGIAAAQGAVAFGALALWFAASGEPGLSLVALCTAGAILGFALWNWAPASIFMGDAGSVSLGMFYAGLALVGVVRCGMSLGAFVVLLGVFIGDATWTLLRRVLRREPFWRAHREHFYQRAVGAGFTHARVSGVVVILACVLAVLATAELSGARPAPAWPAAALVLLLASGAAVIVLERRKTIDK